MAAVQRLPQPETMSTRALTPCFTNLSDQQAPFRHDTQQAELTNDEQTNLFVETHSQSPQAVQQEPLQETRPSYRGYAESQHSTDLDPSSPSDRNDKTLGSRRSNRTHIEDGDKTKIELESSNSQFSAGLENQSTVSSSTRHRRVARSKSLKPMDHLQCDIFTKLPPELRSNIQRIGDVETLV